MTGNEQFAQTLQNTKDIAAIRESLKGAHKRIDRTDKLTESVHELAQSNTAIATEVGFLVKKVDKSIERMEHSQKELRESFERSQKGLRESFEQGQKSQGERLGRVELAIQQIERNEKDIADNADKIDALRLEPAARWKDLTTHIKLLIIGAIFCGIAGVATFILTGVFGG